MQHLERNFPSFPPYLHSGGEWNYFLFSNVQTATGFHSVPYETQNTEAWHRGDGYDQTWEQSCSLWTLSHCPESSQYFIKGAVCQWVTFSIITIMSLHNKIISIISSAWMQWNPNEELQQSSTLHRMPQTVHLWPDPGQVPAEGPDTTSRYMSPPPQTLKTSVFIWLKYWI